MDLPAVGTHGAVRQDHGLNLVKHPVKAGEIARRADRLPPSARMLLNVDDVLPTVPDAGVGGDAAAAVMQTTASKTASGRSSRKCRPVLVIAASLRVSLDFLMGLQARASRFSRGIARWPFGVRGRENHA